MVNTSIQQRNTHSKAPLTLAIIKPKSEEEKQHEDLNINITDQDYYYYYYRRNLPPSPAKDVVEHRHPKLIILP